MPKNPDKRYEYAGNVSWRRVAQDAVILNLETSAYYSLNETSALIWERLGAGASVKSAAAALCRAYGVNPKEAEAHVEALVEKLLKAGVLLPSPLAAAPERDLERSKAPQAAKRPYLAPALAAFALLGTPPLAKGFGSGDL